MCIRDRDWGIELPEIWTATAFVDDLIKSGRLSPRREEMSVSYHDGSRLARDLDEHQPARDILTAMGCEIHEMWQNRRLAKCCGSAVMGQCLPELRDKVASGRWNDVKRTPARVLVAACPQSTEALQATVPEGYTYRDLFVPVSYTHLDVYKRQDNTPSHALIRTTETTGYWQAPAKPRRDLIPSAPISGANLPICPHGNESSSKVPTFTTWRCV